MIDAKACSSWDWLRLIEVSVTTYPFFKVLIFKMLTVGPLLLPLLWIVIGGGLICQYAEIPETVTRPYTGGVTPAA